jgi:hypothetical protein
MNKSLKEFILLIVLCLLVGNIYSKESKYRIYSFKKIGGIKEGFSTEESNYFWRIDDLCCDDENSLYVADRGWSKIFKFDSNGQFIMSFGGKGQGPGEFGGRGLGISFGNDGNIYVFDRGNFRLSVFSKKGEFTKSFSLPQFLYDKAQVNSKEDIYLVSTSGEKVIDCYDKNFKLKNSFLDIERHFYYPFLKPNFKKRSSSAPQKDIPRRITEFDLNKVITKKDHLIALSNFSLTVFHFNENNKLVNEFKMENRIFIDDFKNRLKSAVGRGAFISPCRMFLDDKENLCFLYYNSTLPFKWEVYRYKIDGTFLDIIRFSEKISHPIYVDSFGNFYATKEEDTEIGMYRIEKEK